MEPPDRLLTLGDRRSLTAEDPGLSYLGVLLDLQLPRREQAEPMKSVTEVQPDDLRTRREMLLERAGMGWQELRALAEVYQLDTDERNIYETIRGIDYLLGNEAE